MYKHEVVKSLDFVIYGCSSWGCIASVLDHYSALISISVAFVALIISTIYKHLNYRNEKKRLKILEDES
jgi:hypothetical protein